MRLLLGPELLALLEIAGCVRQPITLARTWSCSSVTAAVFVCFRLTVVKFQFLCALCKPMFRETVLHYSEFLFSHVHSICKLLMYSSNWAQRNTHLVPMASS